MSDDREDLLAWLLRREKEIVSSVCDRFLWGCIGAFAGACASRPLGMLPIGGVIVGIAASYLFTYFLDFFLLQKLRRK